MAAECRCSLLAKFAEDPDVAIEAGGEPGELVLRVTADVAVCVVACFFCGGRSHGQEAETRPATLPDSCTCGALSRFAVLDQSTVSYDAFMNEYCISGRVCYYCPACGGRLQRSKRADFFTDVSFEEMEEARKTIEGARTLVEVAERLGAPDMRMTDIPPPPELQRRLYNLDVVREQWSYSRYWRTLVLDVSELADGTVRWSFGPKHLLE